MKHTPIYTRVNGRAGFQNEFYEKSHFHGHFSFLSCTLQLPVANFEPRILEFAVARFIHYTIRRHPSKYIWRLCTYASQTQNVVTDDILLTACLEGGKRVEVLLCTNCYVSITKDIFDRQQRYFFKVRILISHVLFNMFSG